MHEAYAYFNSRLFNSVLPKCLITMQRKGGTYGYFAGERFGTTDGKTITDEIAPEPVALQAPNDARSPVNPGA
jgi:hypothetical protein